MSAARTRRVSSWGEDRVLWTWRQEISRRGWETEVGGDSDWGWHVTPLSIAHRDGEHVLLKASGVELYGTHVPLRRNRTLAYVGGHVGTTPWARRVPGTTTSVADALGYLVPAEVARREHVRHGSQYLTRMERASATTPSGRYGGHAWDADRRAFLNNLGTALLTAPRSWPGVKVVGQREPA